MRAAGFFTSIVEPTVNEFFHAEEDIRRGFLAAIVLYHMFDYWQRDNATATLGDMINKCPEFAVIRDVADASKHSLLCKPSPKIPRQLSSSEQIARPPGLFEAPFGIGRFGEATHVIEVTLDDGTIRLSSDLIRSVFSMWKAIL
jgi:hypothetical protein